VSDLPGITLVVSQGSILRILLVTLLGAEPPTYRRLRLGNGSFAVVRSADPLVLVSINVNHLPVAS